MTIGALQRPYGTFEILIYLHKHKKSTPTKIINKIKISREGCYAALEKLQNMGLIFSKKERGFPMHHYFQLTLNGEKMASYLLPVDAMVTNTIEGFKLRLSALEKSRQTHKIKKETIDLLYKLFDVCHILGEWNEAIEYSKKALKLSEEISSNKDIARAYLNIGNIFLERNDLELAQNNFENGLKLAEKIKDFKECAELYYSMASVFENLGAMEDAYKNYKISEKCGKDLNDESIVGKAYLGLGRYYSKKGQYEESIKLFNKSKRIFEEANEIHELAKTYSSLGASYFYIDLDKALKWLKKSIVISERIGNLRILGYSLANAAGCYKNKKEYKISNDYLDRALEIFNKIDDKGMIANIYFHYATIYQYKENWHKSKDYFTRSLNILSKLDTPYQLGVVHGQFGIMLKDKGDHEMAMYHLNKALDLFKLLNNEKMIKRMEEELEQAKFK